MLYKFFGVQVPDYLVELTCTISPSSLNETRELMQLTNVIFTSMQEKYVLNLAIKAKMKENIAARYILRGQNQDNLLSMAQFYYAAFINSPFYFMRQLGNKIFKSFN